MWSASSRAARLALLAVIVTGCTGAPSTAAPTVTTPSAEASVPSVAQGPERTPEPTPEPTALPVPVADSRLDVVLGRPTDTSIAVSIVARDGGSASVAYRVDGRALAVRTEPVQLAPATPTTVELAGLAPSTAYRYTVILDGIAGGEHGFRTARDPGEAFTFTIDADPHYGDPRFSGDQYLLTLANALTDAPDLHVDLGDTFMTEKTQAATETEAEATFAGMRPYLASLAADVPLFLVNGNHDGELGWLTTGKNASDLPAWSAALRQRWFPGPVPGDGNGFTTGATSTDPVTGSPRDGYYAFRWGDARFIVLDPFWYTTAKPAPGDPNGGWGWTLGREQYDWLAVTLAATTSPYTFVFIHHLVGGGESARGGTEVAGFYEWGGANADGTDGFNEHRPGWGVPIHDLLVAHGVSAVFHGHDHVYVRQELDGIVYQELPQPSISGGGGERLASEYGYVGGDVVGSSGHLRVTVSAAAATVAYVRSVLPGDARAGAVNGEVQATYDIAPRSSLRGRS